MHVRAIQFDPCAYLVSSADGPVTGDEDIDLIRHALEQTQPIEVVLDRVRGVQVGEWHEDVRKHVAGDENAALLDQQRRMALGMRRMLDDPDLRAIPRYLVRFGGQPGDEAEPVQRYLARLRPLSAWDSFFRWWFATMFRDGTSWPWSEFPESGEIPGPRLPAWISVGYAPWCWDSPRSSSP